VLVEAAFQYELDGIPVSGVIDALDVHAFTEGPPPDVDVAVPGEAHILRDLKTAKQRPRKGKYRLQTTLYWLGAEELGYPPDQAQLDYIVKTKVPYYWPEVVGPITEDDVDVLSATLQAVDNGVSREDYDPTGLGTMACSMCPHKAICGPYERYLELTNPIRKDAR
jgi:CRISPR/Cas system-associated exonuclease Cas4 (RecB family)